MPGAHTPWQPHSPCINATSKLMQHALQTIAAVGSESLMSGANTCFFTCQEPWQAIHLGSWQCISLTCSHVWLAHSHGLWLKPSDLLAYCHGYWHFFDSQKYWLIVNASFWLATPTRMCNVLEQFLKNTVGSRLDAWFHSNQSIFFKHGDHSDIVSSSAALCSLGHHQNPSEWGFIPKKCNQIICFVNKYSWTICTLEIQNLNLL